MRSIACSPFSGEDERGSAPVEFTLVSALLVALTLAVLQLTFVAHVRTVAIDSAIAGAAHAALADSAVADGVARTRDLLAAGIAPDLVRDVTGTTGALRGRDLVSVTVTIAVPIIGPWLEIGEFEATGRAYREVPRVVSVTP